jgi:hypothetical protein
LKCPTSASHDESRRLRPQAQNYLILNDTLYRRGVDCILRWCLIHEEEELVLNGFHTGECGDHLFGLVTTQNILRVGYFCPSLIKDCVEAVKKCHPCQIFSRKMRAYSSPMFHVIVVGPFTKWDLFHYMSPKFSQGPSLHHRSGRLLHKVGRGYANI